MMESAAPLPRLTQTTLGAYFPSIKDEREQVKTRIRRTRKLIVPNRNITMISPSSLSVQITEKRHLPAEIFSEDEVVEENDGSVKSLKSNIKKKSRRSLKKKAVHTTKTLTKTLIQTKRSAVDISINRPSVIHSPQKERQTCWVPKVTSTPLSNISVCSISSNSTSASSISFVGEPNGATNVNEESTLITEVVDTLKRSVTEVNSSSNDVTITEQSPKKIKIIENLVVETPNKKPVKKSGEASTSKLMEGEPEVKLEVQDSKANFFHLKTFLHFIEKILSTHHLRVLIQCDQNMIMNFCKAKKEVQFICVKLFMRQRTWYGISKLCENVGLKLFREEVVQIYNELKDSSFVLTDFSKVELATILNVLDRTQLQQILKDLKFKNSGGRKHVLIQKLIDFCNTQSTLTHLKSMEEILRDKIKHQMGFSVMLKPEFDDCLFRIYLLNTFANAQFHNPKDYFKSIAVTKTVFPKYQVEKYVIFYTSAEFFNYADAVQCRNALDQCALESNKLPYMLEICERAFDRLKEIMTLEQAERPRPVYLRRFLASNCYAEVLTAGAGQLTAKYSHIVHTWLEYLLTLDVCPHRRSSWINTLALIHGHYFKMPNAAIEIICKALEKPDLLCDFQIDELVQKAEVYAKRKVVTQLNLDKLATFCRRVERDWPSIVLDRKQIKGRNNNDLKFVEIDKTGEKIYLGVEQVALRYYLSEDFNNGGHYENWFLSTFFCLLFWDIIYETYVQGTFVSDYQYTPLDLKCDQFYSNRKNLIDKRLKDIESGWSVEQLEHQVVETFNNHSNEDGVSRLDLFDFTPDILTEMMNCIGRKVLSKILERLVLNYRFHRSGFPDLFLWNHDTKECKFVEVKSENDVLSLKQKLWLNYLQDSGANIELCHVHSIGMKKKTAKRGPKKE